jgi:hypothetical protein
VPVPYYVHLDSFHISHTRARHNDTDGVDLTAQAYPSGQATSAHWGPHDVNNGDHSVDLVLGPFNPDPDDLLTFNYSILNNGHGSWNDVFNAQGQAGVAAAGAAIGTYIGAPGGPVGAAAGAAIGSLLGTLTGLVFVSCDGVVAADSVGPFTGTQLANLTASGSYSETRHYPGTDSPWGCGSNSSYDVTWHISRNNP